MPRIRSRVVVYEPLHGRPLGEVELPQQGSIDLVFPDGAVRIQLHESAHESSEERKELISGFDQLAVILAEKDEEIEKLKVEYSSNAYNHYKH